MRCRSLLSFLSPLWLLALTLVGCISEDDFPTEFTAVSCDLAMECQGSSVSLFETRAQCEEFYAEALSIWTAECDYDPYKGRDCVQAMADATCDDRDAIGDACEVVYTGPDCAWSQ